MTDIEPNLQTNNEKLQKIQEVLDKATKFISAEEINLALDKIASEMNQTLVDSNPIFVCVLHGAIVAFGNLLPRLNFHLEVDYAHVTRYMGKTSGGEIVWKAKPVCDFNNRNVVVFDDIFDGGITLAVLKKYFLEQGASKVYTATLIDKRKPREQEELQEVDFYGIAIEDKFIFGYGLDYDDYLRNTKDIYVVAPEHQ